jgi:hypothetical protein
MSFRDPEKKKAWDKAYYEANREKRKACNKAYYEANREKIKAYREANREKRKACTKAYYETNREKLNAHYKVQNADPLNSARRTIYNLTGLKKAEIPTELLEAQALIIQINREIKNHEKLHRA